MDKTDLAAKIRLGLESAISGIPNIIAQIIYPPHQAENLLEFYEAICKSEDNAIRHLKIKPRGCQEFLEFQVDLEELSERLNLAEPRQEGIPGVYSQVGLYLTAPHGRLIWEGKKTAIIKSIKLKSHLEKPLYLLSGDLCFGIIKLSQPKEISLEQFASLYPKHMVSEEERKKWWPQAKILYLYTVSFIRRWDSPRRWKRQQGAQLFVNNVQFLEETISGPSLLIFLRERNNPEYQEDETREESIQTEQSKYGDWYAVRVKSPQKVYRYVAQYHTRGNSTHIDLRFEANDHLVGWTLNTPGVPEGSGKSQAEYQHTKEDKFLEPRNPSEQKDYQILAERKLIQPKVWLTVKGRIEAGGIGATKYKPANFEIISTGRVRFGTQKHDFHEYFLDPDDKWNQEKTLKGRWLVSYIPRPQHYQRAGEGKFMWAVFKPNDQRPYVEYQNLEEAIKKAENEKGYMLWQHPYKGLIKEVDFRENKKKTWVY